MTTIIGVDIGGTQMRAARYNHNLERLEQAARPTLTEQGTDSIVERLLELIQQVYPETPGDLAGIGIAAPGPLDPVEGVILNPPNLPFHYTPIKQIVKRATRLPVTLGNDANLAALAEHRMGAGQGTAHMVYLTVSTGLGTGLILNGELFTGRGQAGEVGFMLMGDTYAEYLIAGPAIAQRARDRLVAGADSVITEIVTGNMERITAEVVGAAAQHGDDLARAVITDTGHTLGRLIASLMHLLHPDMVVIGGGVSKIGAVFFDPIREAVREYAIDSVYHEDVPIVRAALGDEAGLYGAALIAKENL